MISKLLTTDLRLPPRPALVLLLLALATGFPAASAQTAATTAGDGSPAKNSDQILQLDPFQVQADSDRSYGALNSNSITRFNTALEKLPVSADIMNERFMKDINATSAEAMIANYSAGAGYGGTNASSNAAFNQPGEINSPAYTTLRGLNATTVYRDGLIPTTTFNGASATGSNYTSTFDLERVEIINGPQALLYGAGGAGGVVNYVSKQARLGTGTFGSASYRIDQYGTKEGRFDAGFGNDTFALRIATVNGWEGTRRVNIGGTLNGQYGQFLIKLFKNTEIKIAGAQTHFTRDYPVNATVTALSTANDARNGQFIDYLFASNQINAAANGAPSGAGPIDNGQLNPGNIDSMFGWLKGEETVATRGDISIETKWNSWLSTQAGGGYFIYDNVYTAPGMSFYAPNATANPIPGHWTVATTAGSPLALVGHPSRTKAARFSALASNDFFRGTAHSDTIVGLDYNRYDMYYVAQNYYQADSNWNVIVNPATATSATFGRTIMPALAYAVDQGEQAYPGFRPGPPRVTLNGQNYVLQSGNPQFQFPVTENDPLGAKLGGSAAQRIKTINSGQYFANNTEWWGKLDTLLGFRVARAFNIRETQGTAPTALSPSAGASNQASSNTFSYNLGADYALLNWLRPYFSVSDSFNAPVNENNDPYGKPPQTSHAVGEEVGVKLTNAQKTISGSLAIYHVQSKNEQYSITNTLTTDINPNGLNGVYGASPTGFLNIDRISQGVQAAVTVTPSDHWRTRISAAWIGGKVGTSTSFAQLYNDQFYENSAGQVTFADGAVVYVPATFNSKALTVTSTTAGAVPLTVAAMSDPNNSYYANPVAVSGAISAASNAAKVLQVVDPTHGAILTGTTGLPISKIQINPGFATIGVIPTSTAGESTTGYPSVSMSLTSIYTMPSGPAKGLFFGGTANFGWLYKDYYYYTNGVGIGAKTSLFNMPTVAQINPILGYRRKLGRVTWSTQLNISNVFNHYQVIILPSYLGGWSGPLNATYTAQPRSYEWTNTIDF